MADEARAVASKLMTSFCISYSVLFSSTVSLSVQPQKHHHSQEMQCFRPTNYLSRLSPGLRAHVHCRKASVFATGPAPPRLPEAEQEVYEKLQNASTGAFSTPKPTVAPNTIAYEPPRQQTPQINQSPHLEAHQSKATASRGEDVPGVRATVKAEGDGEELHPDVRRGAKAEFEGEKNPVTGEVGGPKNEPLRWGGEVDWSYNGRVTDF